VEVGVRPEDLTPANGGDVGFLPFEVDISERLGDVTVLYSRYGAEDQQLIAKLPGIANVRRGEKLDLTAAPEKVHVFHHGASLHYM